MKMQCPQCGAGAPLVKFIGNSAFCTCGWYGPIEHEQLKKYALRKKSIARILVAVSLTVTGFILYEYKNWGSYMGNHVVIRAKALVGAASVEDWQELGLMCATMQNYECSEKAFREVVKLKPRNEFALLQLGYAQTKIQKHQSAVATFESLFKNGAAGYISTASYAESMAALGRDEDAKTWYYRSIRLEPRAVGTVDKLVDLLVKKENYAEALSLIGTVSALVPSAEQYFSGRMLALNDLLEKQRPAPGQKTTVKLAGIQNMHFLPVRFDGMARPEMFMVDSGASMLVMSADFLNRNDVDSYKSLGNIELKTADGRIRKAKLVQFSKLYVGPWKLENIKAAICENCALLAGKTLLNQFQMSSEVVKGVEYLSLKR